MEAMTQRQSNNFRPEFSDEECITVYLRGICQRRFEQRTIYDYTTNHLLDRFPKLPSYAAFSRRLNFLAPAFQALAEEWLTVILKKEVENTTYIVDSCPVILAKGPRSGYAKAVEGLRAKSYNSSHKEWYYGVKLHAFVARKPGRLPAPMGLFLSGAAVHDLKAAKQILQDSRPLPPGTLYADKAYIDSERAKLLQEESAIQILTPLKKHKSDAIRPGDAFSSFVSSVRQPIECFSNWLNRFTNLRSASTVRSLTGLLLHIFVRIAAALFALMF